MSAATAQRLSIHHATRPVAVVHALAATLAVWLIADPVAGVELAVRTGAAGGVSHVGPGSVVLATLFAALAACGLLAALERFVPGPRATWVALASAALALSLAGPILLGQTSGAIAMLTSMHLAAAGVLIPTLARSTRR